MDPLLQALEADPRLGPAKSLALAFLYQDSATRHHSTLAFEFLLQALDESIELSSTWWRLALLSDPKLARTAARAIGQADLIFVAFNSNHEVPARIDAWLDSWQLARSRRPKLVALLGPASALARTHWDARFRLLADRGEILYLPGWFGAGLVEELPGESGQLDPAAGLEVNRVEPYQHWGLNE